MDYAVTGAPETAFISRSGIVVSKFIGPIDDEFAGPLGRDGACARVVPRLAGWSD